MKQIRMRFPEGRAKCLTLSYDDGVEQDIQLAELMKQYGIAGTFNINAGNIAPEGTVYEPGTIHRRMTLQQCRDTYLSSPLFEVATHGYTHPFLDALPSSEAVYQVIADRRALEQQFGGLIRGHAYPYGTYNSQVMEILDKCGIVYARTIRSTCQFELPENWLELHPTCHHQNPQLMELAEKFLTQAPRRGPWMFYLWGHSYEFEEQDNWQVIADFFQKMAHHPDIWYATNIQVYDYIRAFRQLIYSADGTTVYNPTDTDLWLKDAASERCVHKIPAGQTIKLGE